MLVKHVPSLVFVLNCNVNFFYIAYLRALLHGQLKKEEDYILKWGPVPKHVQLSVLLSINLYGTCIEMVHFLAWLQKVCGPPLQLYMMTVTL